MTRSCHTTQFGCFELVGEGLAWHALKHGGGGYQDEGGGDDDDDDGDGGGDGECHHNICRLHSYDEECVSVTW